MTEDSEGAIGELKRADHSLYVTLKYTKTVDVIKSTIKRLISALDYASYDLLEALKDKKKIKEIPSAPISRFEILPGVFKKNKEVSKVMEDYVNFYYLLRKLDKSTYKAKEEYRKNITLITPDFDVNIYLLTKLFKKTKDFVKFAYEFERENK